MNIPRKDIVELFNVCCKSGKQKSGYVKDGNLLFETVSYIHAINGIPLKVSIIHRGASVVTLVLSAQTWAFKFEGDDKIIGNDTREMIGPIFYPTDIRHLFLFAFTFLGDEECYRNEFSILKLSL